MPLIGKVVDLMHYLNVMDTIRPAIMKVWGYFNGDKMYDLNEIERMNSPRIFKSHLPFFLLHPKLLDTSKVLQKDLLVQTILFTMIHFFSQVVYIARNPKDVIVSFFHYTKLMHHHKFTGNLEAFAEYFISDKGLMSNKNLLYA